MPRIDPQKLLTCISVLLAPNGGIRSTAEVKRLASLMAKYSKKLVSKCIYIQILKCTETDLLGQFMASGGWSLAHMWLTDCSTTNNWPLVQEILELLLLCPVDVKRLQSNSAPKMVKYLSREGGNEGVRILASKLVEQWLKIAKGETMTITNPNVINSHSVNADVTPATVAVPVTVTSCPSITKEIMSIDQNIVDSAEMLQPTEDPLDLKNESSAEYTTGDETDSKLSPSNHSEGLVYKLTVRDGKQVLAKVNDTAPRKSSLGITLKSSDDESAEQVRSKSSSSNGTSSVDKKIRSEKDSSKSREHRDKDKPSSNSSRDGKNRSDRDKDRKSGDSSHKSSSKSSSSRHSSSSSSSDKNRDKLSSSKSSSGSSHKSLSSSSHKSGSSSSSKSSSHKSSSSSSSSRDKHKSSSSSASKNSSKDKEKKDEENKASQADKDKATLAKVLPQTISKMAKIPKKSATEDGSEPAQSQTKKSTISIEVRKDAELRPKTVKTFNSQFRSHGLAEEAPPPPSRRTLKKPAPAVVANSSAGTNSTTNAATTTPPKRSLSPITATKESIIEKKIKLDSPIVEKPGAIKLIPAKPKPSVLVESDMFMDAISAATTKKEPSKKRKRLSSASKENESTTVTTPVSATKETKDARDARDARDKNAPMKFYQDTLDENEGHKEEKVSEEIKKMTKSEIVSADDEPTVTKKMKKEGEDTSDTETMNEIEELASPDKDSNSEDQDMADKKPPGPGCGPNGPPGVLALHRRKGPKKALRWRESLEDIRYFELDENERVNVTKTFVDMKQMERTSEREAFLSARKVGSEDMMAEQTEWTALLEIDNVPEISHGSNSKEKEIQAEREKTVLKTIYFNRGMIPDSPAEPDVVMYPFVEPQIMPLIDVTGNPDAIHDFTNMPWPESKGSPPPSGMNMDMNDMPAFSNFTQFGPFGSGNNMAMGNSISNMGNIPNMGGNMPNMGNMGNMPLGMGINGPHPMPGFTPMMGGPPDINQMPPFHGPMGPNFGPNGPGPNFMNNFGPPMHMNENNNRGRNQNWTRNNNPGMNWQAPMGGGPPNGARGNWVNRDRICKQFQRGFCRHGDKCKFMHPGVNCPPI